MASEVHIWNAKTILIWSVTPVKSGTCERLGLPQHVISDMQGIQLPSYKHTLLSTSCSTVHPPRTNNALRDLSCRRRAASLRFEAPCRPG